MDEQQGRDFDAVELLLLIPLALALWNKYAPRTYKNRPDQRYLILVLNGIKAEMRVLTEQFRTGGISQAQWLLDTQRFVDVIYLISSAVLAGNFDLATPTIELGSEQWRNQDALLANFDRQVSDGEQKKNGTLLTRVGLYASAGWGIYQGLRGIKAMLFDAVTEARILGKADHCQDCLDEAIGVKGRQPIGTLRKIGDSVCGANCHCHFVYFNSLGQEIRL